MEPTEFTRRALQLLGGMAEESGKVIYSTAGTLRPGPFYVLGYNPGGTPGVDGTTIRGNLEVFPGKDSNDYLDEPWGTRPAGAHRLQRNVAYLFHDLLCIDLRGVFASNLIFVRSPNARQVNYELAHECWCIHELMLNIVCPKVIIALSNGAQSPYQFLLNKSLEENPSRLLPTLDMPSGHGSWRLKAFSSVLLSREVVVVGIPHMSRYTFSGKPDCIKDALRHMVADGERGTADLAAT